MAQYGEKLEAVVGLVAIGVLLLVLNWFFHKVYWTQHISKFHKERKRLLGMGERGWLSAQAIGFIALGFTTVYREGFETVLFLQALELNSGLAVVLEGVALGLVGVFALAFATFVLERKLPYRKMLIVTGVLLTIVLAIMVGKTVRTMQGVGWMPITPIDIDPPFWTGLWLGFFPTVETIVAQIASVFFVIGSYFAAERIKKRRQRQAQERRTGSVRGIGRLDELDLTLDLDKHEYEKRLESAQDRLAELRLDFGGKLGSERLGPPVCVLLEGGDASGKGGAIKRLTARLDLRHVRVAQFSAPNARREAPPLPLALLERPARLGRHGRVRPHLVRPRAGRAGGGLRLRRGVGARLRGDRRVRAHERRRGHGVREVLAAGLARGAAQALPQA